MEIRGVELHQLFQIASELGMEISNDRRTLKSGDAYAFKLSPVSSQSLYARRSAGNGYREGRALKALCYHGFRDFICTAFDAGATCVISAMNPTHRGKRSVWRCRCEFERDLPDLADVNVGSMARPSRMIDLCWHYHRAGVFEPVQPSGYVFEPSL